jgi:CRISPR/Cas system-associated exonuclease Cas4 (RecB family)
VFQEVGASLVEARYSISSLASSIHYNCKKHIYLLSRAPREKKEEDRFNNSVANAHCDRGNVFEDNLFQMHKSVMVDHTHSTDFKKILQEAEAGTYLYQLKFKLPESFYTDVIGDTTAYRINNFIPDFLYIREDPVTKIRKILIIDAKSSKEMSKSHQFQVTSYAFFLNYLIQDIRNLEVDDLGGVWLPSDVVKPVTFRIDFVLNKIKFIFTDTLVEISRNSNPEWILGKKCNSCQFVRRCKADAKGTVRSIPYMNEEKATRLIESPMVDIEDLSELLQNLKIENSSVGSPEESNNSTTGYEGYIDAYKDKKPRFMGYASVMTARETDHSIFIYLQIDNFSQRPFVYGITTIDTRTNKKVLDNYFAVGYGRHLEDGLEAYSAFIDHFVGDLADTLHLMDENESRCLIYVYNGQEKSVIQNILNDLVSSEGRDLVTLDQKRKDEIISDAMRCLVVLFQDTQLLGLPGVVQFPDMDDIQRTSSVGRFVSIEELLQQNIALGVSGFYNLSDAVEWMAGSFLSGEDDDLSGLDMNDIYDSWKASMPPIIEGEMTFATEHYVIQRFFWLQEIMNSYWILANAYMEEIGTELFPLVCKPFKWPVVQPFRHQMLAKLVFFRQLECIKACDELRMDRIRDLSGLDYGAGSNEISLGGLVIDLIGQQRISQYVTHLRFSARAFVNGPNIQQKLDRISIDDFKRYILVPDTREVTSKLIRSLGCYC